MRLLDLFSLGDIADSEKTDTGHLLSGFLKYNIFSIQLASQLNTSSAQFFLYELWLIDSDLERLRDSDPVELKHPNNRIY